ncbi:uncharacterized protein LOC132624077 [Lycium barbarum]|uniref:uncharacterized protein LOC132624077 n=1 Tax=Lycium barbarum TaxID=112863 RepID=UPI00293ED73D|nr:uncharacterized protein LOC132624077 [Lycium barbarum]
MGVVLMQDGRPLTFFSKALSHRQWGLSTYEKEYMAFLVVVDRWRHYLQGAHFVIRTDHHNLKYLLEQKVTIALQQKGLAKLVGLKNVLSSGLLQPLPISTQPWQDIAMDFLERQPKSEHKDVILVVIDMLTKYGHILALKRPYSAHDVAALFLKEIYKLHGLPSSIVTDRDAAFISQFWQQMFKAMGTKLICLLLTIHKHMVKQRGSIGVLKPI